MWIFSSLGRPDLIRRVVDSYEWGSHSPVKLVLYEKDPRLPEYLAQDWPASFSTEIVPMRGNGPTYNEILRRYPNEKFFGFLADDAVLDVQGMLRMLENAAEDWNVAYANDQHHEDRICTMPCIGGELVRAAGYLAPPNIMHLGIDCIWHEIGRTLGCLRYFPRLTYTHLHPLFGTAEVDNTYLAAQNISICYQDAYRGWLHGGGLQRVIDAANAKMAKSEDSGVAI